VRRGGHSGKSSACTYLRTVEQARPICCAIAVRGAPRRVTALRPAHTAPGDERDGLCGSPERSIAHQDTFQHRTGIVGEMEAIRDLPRCWCPVAGRVSIGPCTITAEHVRQPRLLMQPPNEQAGRPLGPHVEHLVSLQINDQGAIVVVAAHREIVDPSTVGSAASVGVGVCGLDE
jgi:hypothetical protein